MAGSGDAAKDRDKAGDPVSRALVLVAYALMVAAAILAVAVG